MCRLLLLINILVSLLLFFFLSPWGAGWSPTYKKTNRSPYFSSNLIPHAPTRSCCWITWWLRTLFLMFTGSPRSCRRAWATRCTRGSRFTRCFEVAWLVNYKRVQGSNSKNLSICATVPRHHNIPVPLTANRVLLPTPCLRIIWRVKPLNALIVSKSQGFTPIKGTRCVIHGFSLFSVDRVNRGNRQMISRFHSNQRNSLHHSRF